MVKQRSLVPGLSVILAVGSAAMVPSLTLAQVVLEEVIVTARKREESLQETPIAVSVFSGDSLKNLGLSDIADLTKVVPNVDMYTGNGTTGKGVVFIRGIGARNTGVNFDSGVGIYVDGVYLSRADGAVLDNVDVQSVQVLRGPQGTLFGKNTTGGAILYTTNRPSDELEGYVEVRTGNFNQLDGKLTVNVPLIEDSLMSRFSVYSTNRDGFVKSSSNGNPDIPDGAEYNDVKRYGGQAQLRWVASDALIFDLSYNYNRTDQASRGQNCEVITGVPGAGWQAGLQDPFIVIPSTGKTIAEWCQDNQDLGIDRIMADLLPNRYEAQVSGLALAIDWELGEGVNFKSISSVRNTQASEVNELDAISIPNLGRTNYGWNGAEPSNTDAYSQEFQLAGTAFDERLDYVVGVYAFHERTDQGTVASPTGPFFNAIFNPDQAFYINQTTTLLARNRAASAFSQLDWNFNDYWRLTMGLRYTWEERELERKFRIADLNTLATTGDATTSPFGDTFFVFPSGPDTFNGNHLFVKAQDPSNPGQVDPLADQKMKTDDTDVTPMLSIQRTFEETAFMDRGSVYFTVANGFLSGGISDTVDVLNRKIYAYEPEDVWNYEIGFKMDSWDNKLRLNTALFYTDYTDRQLTTVRINPDTGRIAGALINAESSSIAGLEIELTIIPIENLQITANATFNNGIIDTYDDERILATIPGSVIPEGCQRIFVGLSDVDNCPIDRSDEDLPRLPDQAYYLAAQYSWEISIGKIASMVSWSYRKNVDNCFDRASCLAGLYEVDQKDLSARLTWTSTDQAWRVTAYGNNLTDDRYISGGTPLVDVTETAGTVYNLPRTYGLEAAYTW